MGHRILLLGIPGVQTSVAARRLAAALGGIGHRYEVLNFERSFLFRSDARLKATFLGNTIAHQAHEWQTAWEELKNSLSADQNYILTLHGCYLNALYGARCVFDPGQVGREFCPDIVFTLITDIYDAWSRTHLASSGIALKGDPTIDQLLNGRRIELLVGDQIALSSKVGRGTKANQMWGSRTRNLMLSAYQPIQSFVNAAMAKDQLRVCYLSFPISQPRELESKDNGAARTAVSKYVRDAYQLQHKNHSLVVECPLAIDELPFSNAMREHVKSRDAQRELFRHPTELEEDTFDLEFDRGARWSLAEICDGEETLLTPPERTEKFSMKQFLTAESLIFTDVSLRDYRLVDQSDFVAAFNPVLDPKRTNIARSVAGEINRATALEMPVILFQDKKYDPKGVTLGELKLTPESRGTMASPPSKDFIINCESYDQLISHIRKGGTLE